MKHIATDVMDSTAKMASMLSAQVTKPGLAMDPISIVPMSPIRPS